MIATLPWPLAGQLADGDLDQAAVVVVAESLARTLPATETARSAVLRPDLHEGLVAGAGDLSLGPLAGRLGLGLGLLDDRVGGGLGLLAGLLDQGPDLVGGLGEFLAVLGGERPRPRSAACSESSRTCSSGPRARAGP